MATATADFDVRRHDSFGLRVQHALHANPVLGPLAVLIVAIIAFSIVNARFLTATNLSLVLQQVTVIATLALGQTLIILTAGIDLSAGAYQAIKSAGKTKDVVIVSIDGGCPGVDNVSKGVIGATSMQFPLKMAQMGVDAISAYAKDGTKLQVTAGKDFVDTGVQLITDDPQTGVDAKDSAWGKQNCWG